MSIEIKNKLIIISSPSGAGKTTLCNMLLKKMKKISLSISYTSRSKRLNEIDGKDYFFVSDKEFKRLIKNDEFLEYAKVFKNFYGTSRTPVIQVSIREVILSGTMSIYV